MVTTPTEQGRLSNTSKDLHVSVESNISSGDVLPPPSLTSQQPSHHKPNEQLNNIHLNNRSGSQGSARPARPSPPISQRQPSDPSLQTSNRQSGDHSDAVEQTHL